jgi:hypothetical protein
MFASIAVSKRPKIEQLSDKGYITDIYVEELNHFHRYLNTCMRMQFQMMLYPPRELVSHTAGQI